MNTPGKRPQPSPEWIASTILSFAKRQYVLRAWPLDTPLWSCRLKLPKLGECVFVELMPTLALRVHDRESGRILAQSLPGEFDELDMQARPVEEAFEAWRSARAQGCDASSASTDGGQA